MVGGVGEGAGPVAFTTAGGAAAGMVVTDWTGAGIGGTGVVLLTDSDSGGFDGAFRLGLGGRDGCKRELEDVEGSIGAGAGVGSTGSTFSGGGDGAFITIGAGGGCNFSSLFLRIAIRASSRVTFLTKSFTSPGL